jgi:hypothetical protein
MAVQENKYTCPGCGSNNVRQMNKFNIICTLLIIAGIFFLTGHFFLKFLWVGTALFLFFALVSLFNKGMLRCKDCDKAWKIE